MTTSARTYTTLRDAIRGDLATAALWFDRAIQSEPRNGSNYLAAARLSRRRGTSLPALLYLRSAHEIDPKSPEILAELLDVLLFHGQRIEAVAALTKTGHARPLSSGEFLHLITTLTEVGRYSDVCRIIDDAHCRESDIQAEPVLAAKAHARLALGYDRDRVVMTAAAREKGARWQSATETHAQILAAIQTKQPFSLVRVGDGEARFLLATDPAPAGDINAAERAVIGNVIWRNWFGVGLPSGSDASIVTLRGYVLAALHSADVLGLSAADRIAIDFLHFGYLAYLDDLVARMGAGWECRFTNAFVHIQLHQYSFQFRSLLSGLDWIGFIGPHQGLAGRLAAALGIARSAEYVIPGEMRLPERADLQRGRGHFPERFDQLMASLTVPYRGAVFLVSGGLLGKIYCARIKELGGIALDIGSISDAWMGYDTRPGQFQNLEQWALPPTVGNSVAAS